MDIVSDESLLTIMQAGNLAHGAMEGINMYKFFCFVDKKFRKEVPSGEVALSDLQRLRLSTPPTYALGC